MPEAKRKSAKAEPVKLPFVMAPLKEWLWWPVLVRPPATNRMLFVACAERRRMHAARGVKRTAWEQFDLFTREKMRFVEDFDDDGHLQYAPVPEPTHWTYGTDGWFWEPLDAQGVSVNGPTMSEAMVNLAQHLSSVERIEA